MATEHSSTPRLPDRVGPLIGICVAVVLAGPADAAGMEFMGHPIEPLPGTYLVQKDVNVRAQPRTNAKRLGGLDEGETVEVLGRAPGTVWLAVTRDGKPFGFVYGTVLAPVLNGALDDDVTGEIRLGADHRCGFRIQFIGRLGGADGALPSADYETTIVCERDGRRIRFPAQMFLSEVPFDAASKSRVFQINVDLFDTLHGLDDVFSTTLLFDLDRGEVRFDRASEGSYVRPSGALASLPATGVAHALGAAVEIALTHWSETAWAAIFENAG